MKKRFLGLILATFMIIAFAFNMTACKQPPEGDAQYTVTETEWDINFNLNRRAPQATPLSAQVYSSQPRDVEAITSFTLSAVGVHKVDGPGSGTIKVAPNGMDMEFYLNGVLREDETQIIPSTDEFYIGMNLMLASYFPFSGQYDEFTYDSNKKAYVAETLKSTVVDESNINNTYDLYNRNIEVKFVNGYISTMSVEMCTNDTYQDVYLTITFTFSNINNTTVNLPV